MRAVSALFDSLAQAGISYCVWKSNQHLDAALAGHTDLDLLIDRVDANEFREVLARHDVKGLVPPGDARHPATEHFLGVDAATGRLFHVHAQYQLVLGQKYVKNYTIPMDRQFLDFVEVLHGVLVPRAELELAILATRALLKYRARDVVKDVLQIRSPGVPPETRAEIAWLEDRTTVTAVGAALRTGGDVIPWRPICEFLATIDLAPRSGLTLLRLRSELRRELRSFRRRSDAAALLDYARAAWRQRRRLRRQPPDGRMAPVAGGATIALVGSDGSGKSTVASAIDNWLGWKVRTRVHYMGSKQPSRRSRALYVGFRVLRRAQRATKVERPGAARFAEPMTVARDALLALHCLSIGRDRARRYRRALRDARSGAVVIFDRFPLEQLSDRDDHRVFDGPQITHLLGSSIGRIPKALAAAEVRCYRQFRLPEHVIMLDVAPDVAAARKPDHLPEVLQAKCRAFDALARLAQAREAVDVARVDANQGYDAVLIEVKGRVWDAL